MVEFPALQLKPDLDEFHTLYISEFFALSAGRTSNGFGVNPIQYSEIVSFLLLGASIAPDSPADYAEVMRLIDNMYLGLKAEKDKREQESKKGSSSARKPPKTPRR